MFLTLFVTNQHYSRSYIRCKLVVVPGFCLYETCPIMQVCQNAINMLRSLCQFSIHRFDSKDAPMNDTKKGKTKRKEIDCRKPNDSIFFLHWFFSHHSVDLRHQHEIISIQFDRPYLIIPIRLMLKNHRRVNEKLSVSLASSLYSD